MTKRLVAVTVVLALAMTGCAGEEDPQAAQERTVLVDYSSDEFATYLMSYYPREVAVRPGDTVVFKQTWTGEAHSVTMGTAVEKLGDAMRPYLELITAGKSDEIPEEEPPEIEEALEGLPWMFADEDAVAQNAAQPCYLDQGLPPEDPATPCTDVQQEQPPFNGRQSYYNSGFIPYEGTGGNTFRLPLSDDIEPGSYFYYCNLHGPIMGGYVDVKPKGSRIPSAQDVNRAALEEVERAVAPMRESYEAAEAGEWAVPDDDEDVANSLLGKDVAERRGGSVIVTAPMSGVHTPGVFEGGINEFVPRRIEAKAGDPITWMQVGEHSISFNVPEYFPIMEVAEDGTVKRNTKLDPPAGGAPPIPDDSDAPDGDAPPEDAEPGTEPTDQEPPSESPAPEEEEEGPPEPLVIDAGEYDGEGFWSSGVFGGDPVALYTLRITKPGTYKYACLIHPPMVGTVEVTA